MSATLMLICGIIGIFIGAVIDYIFFRIWHNSAHSKKLKEIERRRKRTESTPFWYKKPSD